MLTSATRGETLTPNPNECNSTLMSGTKNIYPYHYIDVSDRGHRLRLGSPVTNYPCAATTEDILGQCKPITRKKLDIIVLHAGTNDLKSNEESSIVKNIVEIKETITNISPSTETMISLVISRYDSELLNDKAIIVNERLTENFPKTDIIDNSNLDKGCVGLKGLHLRFITSLATAHPSCT